MEFKILGPGEGNKDQIGSFMKDMDKYFIPPLATRINLDEYIDKIFNNATKFTYFEGDRLIAIGINYVNKAPDETFGTYLVVDPEFESYGLGLDIALKALKYAEKFGTASFRVKIRNSNKMLNKFYLKQGFKIVNQSPYPDSDDLQNELIKYFDSPKH